MPRTSTIATLVSAWLDTTKAKEPTMDKQGQPVLDDNGKPVFELLVVDSPELDVQELSAMGQMSVVDFPENIRERLAGLKEPIIVYQLEDDDEPDYLAWFLNASETKEARLRAAFARQPKKSMLAPDKKALKSLAMARMNYLVALGRCLSVGCNAEQIETHAVKLSGKGVVSKPDQYINLYTKAHPPKTADTATQEQAASDAAAQEQDAGDAPKDNEIETQEAGTASE